MKLTKPKVILVGDLHLRLTQPPCRVDNFVETQWRKLQWLWNLADEYNVPIIQAGDVFHSWKCGSEMINEAIIKLPHMTSIPGNHDLPQHDIRQLCRTPFYSAVLAGRIDYNCEPREINGVKVIMVPFGQQVPDVECDLLVLHEFNYKRADGIPYPGCTSNTASQLLKKYPKAKCILTGDNHQPFTETYKGRTLINPGSFTRQTAKETHQPVVYLWNPDGFGEVPVPTEDVISRHHIDTQAQVDERIAEFVQELQSTINVRGIDFLENVRTALRDSDVHPKTEQYVMESIEQ